MSKEMDISDGVTRMESAFGSGDGDRDAKATVAKNAEIKGAIFEQSYRPWRGSLGPRWVRNYSIFRHHVYGLFSSKGHRSYPVMVRLTILGIFLFSLSPVFMLPS